jgi:hypothetical protein
MGMASPLMLQKPHQKKKAGLLTLVDAVRSDLMQLMARLL